MTIDPPTARAFGAHHPGQSPLATVGLQQQLAPSSRALLMQWTAPLVLVVALAAQTAPNEHVDTWPDGSIKLRSQVDDQGRKHGTTEAFAETGKRTLLASYVGGQRQGSWREWRDDGSKLRVLTYQNDQLHGFCEEFHPDGKSASVGEYRQGKRTGRWVDTDATGGRKRTAEFREGVRHGAVSIQVGAKVVSRQTWKNGDLLQLDGLQPFPVHSERLRKELRTILEARPAALDPKDSHAASRHAALARLTAYRHLCGLTNLGLTLVPEWNQRCDAAAEVCRRLGELDHHPRCPDGMDPARYQLGAEGARNSNLANDRTMAASVDSYMDDSDPSNIDRVGHRRWCLNPAMRKVGFGSAGEYQAMWAVDASGTAPKGVDVVCYPPCGFVPVDLFGPRHACSITRITGSAVKPTELRVTIRNLDDDYVPAGLPLDLDHCAVAGGGAGTGTTIVFRAKALEVTPGRRYFVEVSIDGGKTLAHRYVFEFCAAVAESAAK